MKNYLDSIKFDPIKYHEETEMFFKDSGINKVIIIDTSSCFRPSTKGKLSQQEEKCYYLHSDLIEYKNYNTTTKIGKLFEEEMIPYKDDYIIEFITENPYNLKWLWRTDGNRFVCNGKITNPNFNNKHQNSLWTQETIINNKYFDNYSNLDSSFLKDTIINVSQPAKADIGAVACTSTGEYKYCLRGPVEKRADFEKWLISITNPNSIIISEDKKLLTSIAASGGRAKALHINWDRSVKNLFKTDST